jgi:hypothetical protein
VANDYVQGRRKRHFGPFAFLVIAVGLASAVILISGVEWFSPFGHAQSGAVLQRHINLVILAQAPLLAAFCAILFRGDRRSFADHLVLAAYTSGFRALFQAFVETPMLALSSATTANSWLVFGYLGVWLAYFAYAASQFYRGNRIWSAFKAIIAAMLSQATAVLFIMAILFVFSRAGEP